MYWNYREKIRTSSCVLCREFGDSTAHMCTYVHTVQRSLARLDCTRVHTYVQYKVLSQVRLHTCVHTYIQYKGP